MERLGPESNSPSWQDLYSHLNRSVSESPSSADTCYQSAEIYLKWARKCLEQARRNFQAALFLNPSFTKSLKNLELLNRLLKKIDRIRLY